MKPEEPVTSTFIRLVCFQKKKLMPLVFQNDAEFGPIGVGGARGDPGLYQTQNIFTEAGEYESVLSFRKGEEEEVHSVAFTFTIRDRATLEIPGR